MNKLKEIVRKYKFSIALSLLIILASLFFLHNHLNPFFAAINTLFIFQVVLLVSKVKNRCVRTAIASILSVQLSTGLTFAILFSTPLSLGHIASAFETNIGEMLSLPNYVYICFFFCLLTTTILIFRAISELKSLFLMRGIVLRLLVLILLINILAIVIPVYKNSSFWDSYKKDLKELPLQTIYAHSAMRSPLIYGDLLGLVVYGKERCEFYKYKNVERKMPKGISYNRREISIPKIYLVVGESAYRGRMSLYGYESSTTPFLDSIAKINPSVISYYDAISIANLTRDAVRFSLSFASPSNKNTFWEEKNIIDLANDANYNTVWLSNQGLSGLYDNYPSYIARSARSTFFESKLKRDDLELLSLLDNCHEKEQKQLIAMHLMGSHFPYSERYDEVDDACLMNADDYDKSIHHTDRFLRQLYNYIIKSDSSSIIVYFSDHGASPERGIHGVSGFEESEYKIPFVILKNNVSLDIDSIVRKYISREYSDGKGWINNLNVSYILGELMGYSVDSTAVDRVIEDGKSIVLPNGTIIPYR